MFTAEKLTYETAGRELIKDFSMSMHKGELIAILGANGAGKSTLLRMLGGEKRPSKGSIQLHGKPLGRYKANELALARAVLVQHNVINLAFTVHEIVLMGRYPHNGQQSSLKNDKVITEVMEITGIDNLAERSYLSLSGGEQQRVHLARTLAQLWDTPGALLLMDEPVNSMDIQYQHQTLAIAHALAQKGMMVITVLHDINLAAQYAGRIIMLKNGRKWYDGTPAEVLSTKQLYDIFEIDADVYTNPKTLKPYSLAKQVTFNHNINTDITMENNTQQINLKEEYAAFKQNNPQKRIRDAAKELNVSEADLLMTGIGETVVRLKETLEDILTDIPTLGYVMALTRNEYCVNERKGEYKNISFGPHAGLVLGEDIDLRLFMKYWKYAFAVNENGRQSIQFFDAAGMALHKIYLTDKSKTDAYTQLVTKFKHEEQAAVTDLKENGAPRKSPEMPDAEVNVEEFHSAWNDMKDSHEFFGILRKFALGRTQALRLAPQGRAAQTTFAAFRKVFEACVAEQVPVMVFTGNHGCIQIHSGHIHKLVDHGPWFNVLDPEFNLHLREDAVANVWRVTKPSTDGDVTSLELYDAEGEMIVQVFGKRKPGIPELEAWREIVKTNL
jgi:putative heme degradation protein/ABC-type hemin transport system ATPase subunit